jgi:hypothetical protein
LETYRPLTCRRYINTAAIPKRIFGIQTAMNGLRPDLVEKVVENCRQSMYTALIAMPTAR